MEHDIQVIKAGKHKIIDELIESMQEFKSTKWEFSNKFIMIEDQIDHLQEQFNSSLSNFKSFMNKTTDNFITEYQDMKYENENISRELKRSLNDYRSILSKLENSDSFEGKQIKIEDHFKLKEFTNKNFSTITQKYS